MTLSRRSFLAVPPLAWMTAMSRANSAAAALRTRNVVLVTTDGLRWQEVFRGAEESLLNKSTGGVANVDALKAEFWRDTPEARREALLPFVWGVLAKQGQLYGNADAGSTAKVTNGKKFSYPGYSEMLTGAPDARIDSNAKRPNPNINVLEWLNTRPEYRGKVAAFGSWDVFPYILNEERAGFPVIAGFDPIPGADLTERQKLINELLVDTHRAWADSCLDSFTMAAAMEAVRKDQPRVLYIALGETDTFAHEGRYDHYLHAAHRFDIALRKLWETLQSMPAYKGSTALMITTDHGRGEAPTGWKSHGEKVDGAENIWIGALGPDTPALGMRRDVPGVTQAQVAATVAALLGADYRAEQPNAAPAIREVVASAS